MSYMFVIGSLASLEFDAKPDATTSDMFLLFETNLAGSDLAQLKVLRRFVDLYNLYRLFQNEEYCDPKGNYVKATLKEYIDSEEELPDYVFEYFNEYESDEDRKKHFPELIAKYFAVEKEKASNPLKEFLQFENEWRILIAGYLAKKMKADLGKALEYEDLSDPIVQMALVQKDSPGDFIFPFEYKNLEDLLKAAGSNPTKQMRALARYRFEYYGEMEYAFPFTLRRLLAYIMQLFQLEEMFALDEIEGKKQLQQLMENKNAS